MAINNNPTVKPQTITGIFTKYIAKTLPLAFDESMSYYECLCALLEYINEEVVPDINNVNNGLEELQTLYEELQSYVNNYFDNLDIQTEINNKLDEMALDGTLTNLISSYVNPFITQQNNTISSFIEQQTIKTNQLETKIDAAASGSPLVAASTDDMTETDRVYVNTTDGKWYYYDGDSWEIGGTYQAAEDSDAVDVLETKMDCITDYIENSYDRLDLPNTISQTSSSNYPMFYINTILKSGANNKFSFTSGNYYILNIKMKLNADDEMTQGMINPRFYVSNGVELQKTKDSQHSQDVYVNQISKNVYFNTSFCFQASESAQAYPTIVVTGAGTTSRLMSCTIDTFVLLEFTTESDYEKYVTYQNYCDNIGLVLVKDRYLNDKIEDIEDDLAELEIPQYDTDIIFWGDSLTAGAGGNGTTYPSVCGTLLSKEVLNYGVGGENANTISFRQGGNNFVIPKGSVNGNYTYSQMKDVFGGNIAPLIQGGQSTAQTLYINGNEATLVCTNTTDKTYSISGYNGDPLLYDTPCYSIGSTLQGKVTVIFVGANGSNVNGDTSVNAQISIIDSMINHLKNDRYVVIGYGTNPQNREDVEQALLLKYGNKFINWRTSLIKYGLDIVNIQPTSQDIIDISVGTIPSSLRSDGVHLNSYGYTAFGKILADRISLLKYFD